MRNGDGVQGSMNGPVRSARKPGYLEFKAAVLMFADAPTAATLVRYLNASRTLERLDPLPKRPLGLVSSHRVAHPSR